MRDLRVEYLTATGPVRAVDGVSFDIRPGEVLGLAGESGCGKSTIAHAIIRILKPPAYITGGKVMFMGQDVLDMNDVSCASFRWEHVSIVFQSAMNALNPVLTIGNQIIDVIQATPSRAKTKARERAPTCCDIVGIDTDASTAIRTSCPAACASAP